MSTKLPVFAQHARRWRNNDYVYPVISRRSRGLSIGINISPDQACPFSCVYCSVDRLPGAIAPIDAPTNTGTSAANRVTVNISRLAQELRQILDEVESGDLFQSGHLAQTPANLRRLNDIAFSGDGEPTASPFFPAAARAVTEVYNERCKNDVHIVLITNASCLHQPEVEETIGFLDHYPFEIWAKLDAGTEAYFRQVDRSQIPFSTILSNLRQTGRVRPITLQSMFVRLKSHPPDSSEIDAYISRLKHLQNEGCRIQKVQIYTSARSPAEKFVTPLEEFELRLIARKVHSLGLTVEVFS